MLRNASLAIFLLLLSYATFGVERQSDLVLGSVPDGAKTIPILKHLSYLPSSRENHDTSDVDGALPGLINKPRRYASIWIDNQSDRDLQLFLMNDLPMKHLQIAGPFRQLPENDKDALFSSSARVPTGRSAFVIAFESGKILTRFAPYLCTEETFLSRNDKRQLLILCMMGIMLGTWLYNLFLTLIAGYNNYGYFLIGSLFLDLFVCSVVGIPAPFKTSMTDTYLLEGWFFWLGLLLYFFTKFLLARTPLSESRKKRLKVPSQLLLVACILAYFGIPPIPRFWDFIHPILIVGAIFVPYTLLVNLFKSPQHRREGLFSVFSWSPLGICGVVIVLFYLGLTSSSLIFPGLYAAAAMQLILTTSFLFALRFQEEKNNQTRLDQLLTIAQDVQTLLVPAEVNLASDTGVLALRHTSRSSQLSGNWGHAWDMADGSTNILLGNVDGTGPRAALAVASIISLVKESIRTNLDLKESLAEISTTLWSIYRGTCASSVTAFHIDKRGYLESFAGKSVGWFLTRGGQVSHESGRGSPLGISSILKLRYTKVQLLPGDTIIAILDATSRSSRELKKLASNLMMLEKMHQNPQDLCEAVLLQIKKGGSTDDTTVLAYTFKTGA